MSIAFRNFTQRFSYPIPIVNNEIEQKYTA